MPRKLATFSALIALAFTTFSCQMGGSGHMSETQRNNIQSAYKSLQTNYDSLVAAYSSSPDTLPDYMNELYREMQQMHQHMNNNHHLMMTRNQEMGRHMEENKMMKQRMQMGRMMQNHMASEWYTQMMGMHNQMAKMHQNRGQQSIAKMHNRLQKKFSEIRNMVPEADSEKKQPFNEKGDPALLNGERLFTQNCSSCHGSDAKGIADSFPPLLNSQWVTGDKSMPIRILLHGLQGEIEVQGDTYNGFMPSFQARLSAAEIASILNYLRDKSEGEHPQITQQDVIKISNKYSSRSTPWQASELMK